MGGMLCACERDPKDLIQNHDDLHQMIIQSIEKRRQFDEIYNEENHI